MSFSTGSRKCVKCGKTYLINLFDRGLCAECEKAVQESIIEELENMPCMTPEEMQKCKDIVKKYTPKQEPIKEYSDLCIQLNGLGWKFVQEPADKSNLEKICEELAAENDNLIGAYKQVCKERDIAIEQLHELGYELGQKIEPKTGHWTNKEFRKEEYVLMGKCSVCGRGRVIDGFCSYCGCRMVEPQESKERSEQW